MKKTKIWAFFGIFAVMAVMFTFLLRESPKRTDAAVLDTNSDGKPDYRISLEGAKKVSWQKTGEKTKQYALETEKVITFNAEKAGMNVGTLTLTLRQIENRDYIYFIKYKHRRPVSGIKAVITAVDADPVIKGHQIIYGPQIDNVNSRWSHFSVTPGGRFSPEHKLPKNAVFLDSRTHHLRLGLVDVFRPLKNHVMLEQFGESRPISILRLGKNIEYILPLPQESGSFTETWGILSTSPQIDWKNRKALDAARVGDLVRYRKLSTDGIYYLTPANYYPTDKTAFWPNPGYHVGELYLKQEAGRYFGNIAISSMYTAIETQNRDGFWPTTPRSDWLYNDYGIPEGFYDTRFNTDAALFLLHMFKKTGERQALAAAGKYAAWLRKYVRNQGIPTSGGGMLVPDYFKPGVAHKKTHVSLNHLVTEMNFLYELYLADRNIENLKTAHRIRQAVRDTGRNWIRPDGDLHYAYLGNGKYGMQDYPLLTLKDLRLSQELITRVDGGPDEMFQTLIEAKENYLKKNNLPVE